MLNGLNPEEIEDIEIVKGPSAATLYGTDAANGVIVVTTKKGRAGNARWNWYGEGGRDQRSRALPGHVRRSGAIRRRLRRPGALPQHELATGACIKDSVTSLNIIEVPELTPLATGNRDQYGVQVSGGNDAMRYFVSGDLENEIGPGQAAAGRHRPLRIGRNADPRRVDAPGGAPAPERARQPQHVAQPEVRPQPHDGLHEDEPAPRRRPTTTSSACSTSR